MNNTSEIERQKEAAIDALRLKAFETNSDADRQAYFDAVSKWFQDRHIRRVVAERIPFLPVRGAVKKLEWDEDGCAKTPFGMYTVAENAEDTWSFTFYDYPYGIPEGEFGTLDEAKAAAQADYEARIRSAIETVIPVSQPSAARSLALEEEFATIRAMIYCYEGDSAQAFEAQKALANIWNAIRALSSPDHADAGKVEADGNRETLWKSAARDFGAYLASNGTPYAIDYWNECFGPLFSAPADAGKVEGHGLPQDVINLVIAAREVWEEADTLSYYHTDEEFSQRVKALDKALEAFSERVPYENEPSASASEGAE